ncbi:hypothetical protein GCM10012275_40770 [Longimycelium tulufanense]|uniref:DUF1707 domain-containing protein n=1 Tax=Longimycelium tulufanense TaxID=907463 RepID=A0A8J3FVT0_9PSEU|nr:DUF1707 domain-containing protein [Longimycelium tulufanense]GGM66030.1 hypothetical protein GCM10012275_40770 [Longimycelium tulufanense]
MTQQPPSGIRIGDTERENALALLGEHFQAGRLNVEEYGERTAKVTTVRTRGELTDLFTDLPEPHPRFDLPVPAAGSAPAPTEGGRSPAPRTEPTLARRLGDAAMGLSGIITLILFFTTPLGPLVFLLPAAVYVVAKALRGEDAECCGPNGERGDPAGGQRGRGRA